MFFQKDGTQLEWHNETNEIKTEAALELFQKAAEKYKILKECECIDDPFFFLSKPDKEAAETYEKVANCYLQLNFKYEAASAYSDASSNLLF